MDKEKLNKAAEEYSCDVYNSYPEIVSDNSLEYECDKAFRKGVDWIMQQPLSERMTEEEKEKIRKWYECATDMYVKGTPIELCGWINLMHDIFGADLFKEK